MFLGDIASIEQHLNNDWTFILKNLKIREDALYELLIYNKRIIAKQRDQDQDELFVNDEIATHTNEVKKINRINEEMQMQESEIMQKYAGSVVSFQEIIKLMGRVGARILETYQFSIDKCKAFDEELMEKYLKTKSNLIKLLNQKDKINLSEITNLVINYTKSKLFNELQKLRKMIVVLQNGDFFKLKEAYHPQPKKILFAPIDKKISNDKVKVLSVGKSEKSPFKEEIIKQEKLKKQKQKLATKLVNNLYSTMELSKQALMEDMCGGTTNEKMKRLYNEIFSRNKFNYEQIIQFQSKRQQFQQKVRIFKEMMQRESRKLSQVLNRKKRQANLNEMNHIMVNISLDQELMTEDREDSQREDKIFSNRYRINSPKTKRDLRQYNPAFNNNMNTTQSNFTHFKFDTNNNETFLRSNRNKLPIINSNYPNNSQVTRAASFDHRIEFNKSKIIRQQLSEIKEKKELSIHNGEERPQKLRQVKITKQQKYLVQRTKMPLKNIEVGVDGVVKKQPSQLITTKEKKKIEPNPMEYTFYVRKSNNKFYEPKHNIIF